MVEGVQTMDLEEFQSLVRDTTAADMDEADMLRFFAEALTETAGAGVGQDPDAIHPKVWLSPATKLTFLLKLMQRMDVSSTLMQRLSHFWS